MIPSNFHNEISNLLNDGLRPFEIAKVLSLNKISVSSYIKSKFNINFSRTYEILYPDYFSEINSYMKAYWLGLLCADGYLVNNPSKIVGIQLSEDDKDVLDSLKEHLKSKKPLLKIKPRILHVNDKTYISKSMYRFTIGNNRMFDDLVNLGLSERKSLILPNVIENIPYKYRDSFIIGYFDGDGCVLLPKGKIKKNNGIWYPSHSTQISIRGTESMLNGIKNHLCIDKKLFFNKTFVLTISDKESIIRFLQCYNNLNFFMKRKHDKLISRISHLSYSKFIQGQTISSPYPYEWT